MNKSRRSTVYIGLGSNIEQPELQIKTAIAGLNNLADTEVIFDSGYYKSKPMGPEDQPDYVNAVVEIETGLSSQELLKNCQSIESQQGRIKTRHWGERTIDLDILLYADEQLETADLILPHPGICQRDFVYMPLLKLNPDVIVPGIGVLSTIVELTTEKTSDYACQFTGNIE